MKTYLLFPQVYKDKILQPLLAAVKMTAEERKELEDFIFTKTLQHAVWKMSLATPPHVQQAIEGQLKDNTLQPEQKLETILKTFSKYPLAIDALEDFLKKELPQILENITKDVLRTSTDEQKLKYFQKLKEARP